MLRGLALTMCLAGCGAAQTGDGVGGGGGGQGGDGVGGGAVAPRFFQQTVPNGATAIDPAQGVRFAAESGTTADLQPLLSAIEQSAAFYDDTQTLIPAVITADATQPAFRLAPAMTLAPDRWFSLRVGAHPSFRLAALDWRPSDPLTTHFFTGSAPTVRYVLRTVPPKGPLETIVVAMSEPVELSTLGATFSSGSSPVPGCPWRENACVSAPVTVPAFDFTFSAAIGDAGLTRLGFAASAHGAGRTMGEGFALTHGTAPLDGGLDYALTGWSSCTGDPLVSCWVAPTP
jgi:hypothetical protein